ncbi:MAG: YybS family protein [Gammaproteobacteria bacterium]
MRRFWDWISGRELASAFLALILALTGIALPLSGTVLALVTLRRGARAGFLAALYATGVWIGLIALQWALSQQMAHAPKLAVGSALLAGLEFAGFWFFMVILGVLIRRGGSLALAVQVASLVALLGVIAFTLAIHHPKTYWQARLNHSLGRYLAHEPGYQTLLHSVIAHAPWIIGTLIAFALFVFTLALFLARWIQSRLDRPGAFGLEFRHFRAGYFASLVFLVVIVLGMLTHATVFDNLSFVLAIMFIYQGLAVLQRGADRYPPVRALRAVVYLLLVLSFLGSLVGPALSLIVTLGALLWPLLTVVGFVDNFVKARTGAVT